MGKFADGSLWHSKSSKCSICGMQKKAASASKGCCRDEYKLAKNEQDQSVTKILAGVDRKSTDILPIIVPGRSSALSFFAPCPSTADAPERSSPHSLSNLICVLRI